MLNAHVALNTEYLPSYLCFPIEKIKPASFDIFQPPTHPPIFCLGHLSQKTTVAPPLYPPIFPPSTWNVHETTLNNKDRTNNRTEGWNHRFSKLVGHNHPTIWTLIYKIRLEVASDETKLAQNNIGGCEPKKKKTHYL
ncbi:MULE domain-containing protein [Aphis craccivora]|uniref:MULE domain-containing protein n=1 Tax=Aphis craccivora TaxID=307492 RepID=A0A6G0VQL3_APHCR|nr:MULE domain-containing protein [Aphis craccivora]